MTQRFLSWRWQPGAAVRALRAVPVKEGNGHTVYLYAAPDVAAHRATELVAQLRAHGFTECFPDVREGGEVCFAIRKVANIHSLVALLEKGEWVGSRAHQETKQVSTPITSSYLRQNAIRGAAASALMVVGLRGLNAGAQHDWPYLAGAGINVAQQMIQWHYGTGTGHTAQEMVANAREKLKVSSVALPEAGIPDNTPKTVSYQARRWLERNPVTAAFGMGIPMGAAFALSGIRTRNPWQTVSGMLVVAGAATIALVPERRKTPEEQETSIRQELWQDVKTLPGTLGYALRHPGQIPALYWDAARESPKRVSALIAYPNVALAFLTARRQAAQITRWREQNPKDIAGLQQEISTLQALPDPHIRRRLYLGTLKADLRKLARQTKLAESKYASLLSTSTYAASGVIAIVFALQAVATKNRLSQQMDKTVFDQLYSLAAQAILVLPPEQRPHTLEALSGSLANEPDLMDGFIPLDTIKQAIAERMEAFERPNPWQLPGENGPTSRRGEESTLAQRFSRLTSPVDKSTTAVEFYQL
jgi:hypothetical protein